MTVDSNGSLHDTAGRFTGAAQRESDAAEVLPPAPSWHAELIHLGFNPGLDSVPVAAAMVLDSEVVVYNNQLVTLTRKRVRGDQVEFTYWKGGYGHFAMPATAELMVVRVQLRPEVEEMLGLAPTVMSDQPHMCTCGAHEYSGCFCSLTAGEFMAFRHARHL